MIYKAKTEQTIFDIRNKKGLISSKWEARISPNGVRYRWDGSNIVEVDLVLKEEGAKFEHGRTLTLNTNGGSWDEQRVISEVLNALGENFELV